MKNKMRTQLVKREDRWDLYDADGHKIASTLDGCLNKLSTKNCQAIERGYDLDELAKEFCENLDEKEGEAWSNDYEELPKRMVEFARKALEILGDKKFSELDMRIAYDAGCNNIDADGDPIDDYNIDFQDTINSLQQTEWDVTFNPEELDVDGCLILNL